MSKLFSYKRYKKIYPDTNIFKYIWRHLLFTPRRWCRIPYCTYMCLKYPFLYRRNRFTGLHYNNWTLINKRDKLNQKYHKHIFDKDGIDMDDFANQLKINDKWYIRVTSEKSLDYWENWWAKPLVNIINFIHNYILQIIFCLPTSIEWDAMEDGWKKAFGKQYLKDLKKQLKKDKMLYSWRITDIKEKYGTQRLYCNWGTEELYNIINYYENLSWNTCIKCGKPATYTSEGWIAPYCEECVNKDNNKNNYIKRNNNELK